MKSTNALIIISIFFLISCAKSKNEPGYEYMPDMVYSQAVEAYSQSSVTPNGASMMYPPKGTIARGYKVFTYGNTDDEKERAGEELMDPREFSEARLKRGEYLYDKMCLVCHGKTGLGDGPIATKYTEPPAFNGRALRNYKPGQIYHAIVKGYGDMPSHEAQLDDNDRWDVILYIQKLQKVE
ncbi:MAG: cytochrome c [Bacteriovoracaceae bacterium]|nr:cytochrome c [Bacteriovoracaceae bacterium]